MTEFQRSKYVFSSTFFFIKTLKKMFSQLLIIRKWALYTN